MLFQVPKEPLMTPVKLTYINNTEYINVFWVYSQAISKLASALLVLLDVVKLDKGKNSSCSVTPNLWALCSWHPAPCFSVRWQLNTPPCHYPFAAAPLEWAVLSPYALLRGCRLQTVHRKAHDKGLHLKKGLDTTQEMRNLACVIPSVKLTSALTDTEMLNPF